MKGDFHVRICERLKLKCFGLLDRNMSPRVLYHIPTELTSQYVYATDILSPDGT